MFYLVVGLVVIGYLIYIGLQKLRVKSLKISCPCTFVAATAIAITLYVTEHPILAWIAFLVGVYLLALTLMAIRKLSVGKMGAAAGAASID